MNRKPVYVFPFVLVSGVTNLTNNGERDWNSRVEDYNTFIMVLNGKENASAVWKGSTRAYMDDIAKENALNGFIGEYKVGDYFNGYVNADQLSTEISSLVGDEQFKAMKHKQSITVLFGADTFKDFKIPWNPTPQDAYHLYIIPELFSNAWMKIENVQKYYNTAREVDRVEVTFRTISDELSDTGGVKRQFITYGSPGEGYAFPAIDENRNIMTVVTRLRETPITSFQIRCDGAAGPSSIYFMGRPCFDNNTNFDGVSTKRIVPPRRLLPYSMVGAVQSQISLIGSATDNYYYVANANMVLNEVYDNWKEKIGDTYSLLQSQKFEGGINLGKTTDLKNIRNTNDAEATTYGKYPNNVKDNPTISIPIISYDAGASPFLEIDRKVGKFTLGGYYDYATILCHNGFINDQVIRQRNTIKNVTTWSLSRIPVIGGFLNGILSGADYGWNNVKTILPSPPFGMFFACELLELAKITGTDDINALACDFFRSDVSSAMEQKAGVGNIATTMRFFITDLFTRDQNINNISQCLYMGQTKDEHGNKINNTTWTTASKPAWRGALDSTRGKCYGYIIDYFQIKMEYEGDYTITFFNDDIGLDPVAVAEWRLISKAKLSGSMREWTNEMKLSFWDADFTTEGTFNWPEVIQFPPPISAEVTKDIEIKPLKKTIINNITTNASIDGWDDYTLGDQWKGFYGFYGVTHEWNIYQYLNNAEPNLNVGYHMQQAGINGAINISSGEIIQLFNNVVEDQAVIKNIEELKRSFKSVKIFIKMEFIGTEPTYSSPAPDATVTEYNLTIEQFLNTWSSGREYKQHVTSIRSAHLAIAVLYPACYQYGFAVVSRDNLTITNGNITFNNENYKMGFRRLYQLGDTNKTILGNGREYRYTVDKIVFLKV